jgi:non-homologous end joining protein Ku
VATTLRYPNEVRDLSNRPELTGLPEANEEELALMTKIADKMTTKDLDLTVYHDGYKERIEALITPKMKGEVAQVKEEKPKNPVAKSMMEAWNAQNTPRVVN